MLSRQDSGEWAITVGGVATHLFLSPAWITEARKIHDEYKDRVETPTETLRMNVTVTDAPFSDGLVTGHVDTTNGSLVPDEGHLADPDVAVIVSYAIARQLLLEQEPDKVMIAFMSGEIEVEGDVTRMMALEDIDASPEQQLLGQEVLDRLTAITE